MNLGSDPADQVVRYTLEGTEFALRLSGTAAKNFAVFVAAVLRDQKKTRGKTNLTRLLREGKPLKFFRSRPTVCASLYRKPSAMACCSCRCATVTTRSISRSPSGPKIPPRWNGSSTGCSWMWWKPGRPRSCRIDIRMPEQPAQNQAEPDHQTPRPTMSLSRLDWTTLTATWVLPDRLRYLRSRRTRRFPARPRRTALGPRRPPPAKTDCPIFLLRCAPCRHGQGVSAPACGRNCGGSRPC